MDRMRVRIKDKRICTLVKAFLRSGVMTARGDREETLTGTPQGGLCSAEHNDPYEQRRIMPSAAVFCLVRGGVVVERCA
jgi:retron-type reverse transcriptase